MTSSLFIAKILGPVFTVVGLGLLTNRKYYQKMIEQFMKTPSLIYLNGIVSLVVGMAVIANHNYWETGWPLAITVLGWAMIIRGMVAVVFPKQIVKAAHVHTHDSLFSLSAVLALVLGLMFTYVIYLNANV